MDLLNHAQWIAFVLIFANQAGVPVFAAPALIGIGALAAGGRVDVALSVALATMAAVCADLLWYGLGKWRGAWARDALRRLSRRADSLVGDAERLFLMHGRAFQLGARFLPELNPVAAAFAATAGVDLRRFVAGGAASAAVWVVTWVGVGYLLAGATQDADLPGTVCLSAALILSMGASVTLLLPVAARAATALARRLARIATAHREVPPAC